MSYNARVLQDAVQKLNDATRSLLRKCNRCPRLLIVVANNGPASEAYVRAKVRAAEALGLACNVSNVTEAAPSEDLTKDLEAAYKAHDAVIVQRPVEPLLEPFIPRVPPGKDVDGLAERTLFVPCTAIGIAYALRLHYGVALRGKDVVIVGRSDLVGRPLARLLTDRDCTVTLCHSMTKNLEEKCANADIVVCAVGKPRFLNYVPKVKGQLVIDVGISRVNGKLVGDVHPDVAEHVDVTPVPGGVGPLTVATLMNSVVLAAIVNNELG